MIIILEGPDGAGKTHVARILNDLLPLSTLIKLSGAPKEVRDPGWMRTAYFSITPFLIEMGRRSHVIVDRAWPSEIVYAPIFKGYTADYLNWWVPNIEKKVDVAYCYLTAPVDELAKRMEQKAVDQPNERHPSADVIEKVVKAYDEWFGAGVHSKARYLLYDTSERTPLEVAQAILDDLGLTVKTQDSTYSVIGGDEDEG